MHNEGVKLLGLHGIDDVGDIAQSTRCVSRHIVGLRDQRAVCDGFKPPAHAAVNAHHLEWTKTAHHLDFFVGLNKGDEHMQDLVVV